MECRIPVITKCFDCENCKKSINHRMYCFVTGKIIKNPKEIDSECPYPKYFPQCEHVFKIGIKRGKALVTCVECKSEFLLEDNKINRGLKRILS